MVRGRAWSFGYSYSDPSSVSQRSPLYKGSKKAEKVHLGSFTATDGHYFQSEESVKPPLLHIMKIFLKTSSLEITVIGQLCD